MAAHTAFTALAKRVDEGYGLGMAREGDGLGQRAISAQEGVGFAVSHVSAREGVGLAARVK